MMAHEGRYFDDLQPGEVRLSAPRRVSEDDMLEFARKYDPQYFHVDPKPARDSIFGGLIASGIYTAALWRILDHEISADIRWICGIAWEQVRWPRPVRAGDWLRARAETLSKRLSAGDPRRGVVECGYSLLNQRNETVFICRSINLVEVRDGRPP